MRILLLEDNRRLRTLTTNALQASGYAVDPCGTISEAEHALQMASYDCLVLDLGLPDGEGLALIGDVRRRGLNMPVLVLTARDGTAAVIEGLNSGADDYLRKPFDMDELVARIRALLRRPGVALNTVLREGNLALDPTERRVWVDKTRTDLSRREVAALEVLLRGSGRVISKAVLEEAIYSFQEDVSVNAIEVLIHRLRKKLSSAGATHEIHTLRGIGYLFSERRL